MRVVIDSKGLNQSNPEAGTSLNVRGNVIATGVTVSGSLTMNPSASLQTVVGGIIFGLLGDPMTGTPRAGDRPLASSVPRGTHWIARDDRTMWTCAARPFGSASNIWIPSQAPSARASTAIVSGSTSIVNHLGWYDPANNRYTPVSQSGQNANALAAEVKAPGQIMFLTIFPASARIDGAPWTGAIGSEVMADATGSVVSYVNNGTNIPLGVSFGPGGITSILAFMMYEY